MDLLGSSPIASKDASISHLAALSAFGSCGRVRACHPTIEYNSRSSGEASFWSLTQFVRAPR